MRSGLQKFGISLAALIFSGVLSLSSVSAAGKADTFTGQVSDAMCGAKHMMAGNPALEAFLRPAVIAYGNSSRQ